MRIAPLVVAAAVLAAALPVVASATTTVSCTPPRTTYLLVALPCSVSGTVTQQFVVSVYSYVGDAGVVNVEARGPGDHRLEFACPIAVYFAVCAGPVALGPAYAGEWTFTARPAVAGVLASAYVRMDVAID